MKLKKSKLMKKRLIIRNLSFKVNEEELEKLFSKFGEVIEVSIPVNEVGKKRGFAFVQYKDSKSQIKAMKALNFKEIYDRPVAIDFAVNKTVYQCQKKNKTIESVKEEPKSESDSESEDEDVKPEINMLVKNEKESGENDVETFLKEFDAEDEPGENDHYSPTSHSSDDYEDDENESHMSYQDDKSMEDKSPKKRQSTDVSEGKTIFIRNVSYKNTEEDLQEIMEEFGEIVYCLLCIDPVTGNPKGTAFVKFKEKEAADKLLQESMKEPGILLDGRKLLCVHAISREDLTKISDQSQKIKDKRNLGLLKCGSVVYGSKESEGVSQTDMAKRAQLEVMKKKKLKNVNFFISDTRLVIHNLPKNISDKDLRCLFKRAADKEAVIKEARVMKDLKKTDSKGIPVSRGFGFVSFIEHKHALQALEELNNNPKIFTASKRPIVEFSVENKVALLSQERKREKLKMFHKKKLEENLLNNKETERSSNQNDAQSLPFNFKKMRNRADNNSHNGKKRRKSKEDNSNSEKKRKLNSFNNISSQESQEKSPKKKQKKKQKNKKRKRNMVNERERNSLTVLTNKYKEKLLNKIS